MDWKRAFISFNKGQQDAGTRRLRDSGKSPLSYTAYTKSSCRLVRGKRSYPIETPAKDMNSDSQEGKSGEFTSTCRETAAAGGREMRLEPAGRKHFRSISWANIERAV